MHKEEDPGSLTLLFKGHTGVTATGMRADWARQQPLYILINDPKALRLRV